MMKKLRLGGGGSDFDRWAKLAHHLFFYGPKLRMVFTLLNGQKKKKSRRGLFCDMRDRCEILVAINKVLLAWPSSFVAIFFYKSRGS